MRRTLLSLSLLAITATAWSYNSALGALIKADYSGKADTLTSVLISQFMNRTQGTFYSTPFDIEKSTQFIYWQQAHAIDVLIYGYERHKGDTTGLSSSYRVHMNNWYKNHANNYQTGGATGFENRFTDDMAWICLSLLHMSDATGIAQYATTAKKVFDNTIIKRAKEDERGFWLPWTSDEGDGPNACTEAPSCLVALKLYLRYNNDKYLEYANKLYDFTVKNICMSNGQVGEPPLSYTQGTFAEACRLLYHITGESIYRVNAYSYINCAFTSERCIHNGLLRDEGSSMDQSIFKGVLIPYTVNFLIDETIPISDRRDLVKKLVNHANTLWRNLDKDSYPAMYCPYYWGSKYDSSKTASMGAMVSGASLMENVARMAKELKTKPTEDGIAVPLKPAEQQVQNIYTLGGRLVRSNTCDTSGLPAGIYIVRGKKIVVH